MTELGARPESWSKSPPAPGYEWVAKPEDDSWTTVQPTPGNRCRWMMPSRTSCKRQAVAWLNRRRWSADFTQRRDYWWAYCGEHLYGRWIENGQVYSWRQEKIN